jgi:hypothetical protein
MAHAGIALAVFYGIYELFLRRETYFNLNRIFLVSGLLLSFIIPAFPVVSPFRTVTLVPMSGAPMAAAPAGRGFSPTDLFPSIYWIGVAFLLFRLAVQLAHLAEVIRQNGIRRLRGLKIVPVEAGSPPFSFFGIVFLAEGLARVDGFRRILAHEEIHIRQQHTLDVLLMEVVLILQWFNPFVWPYKKALQATHEYLADSGVIAQGFSPVGYQLLMFEQKVGASLFELGNNFRRSQISRRIMMLSKAKSPGAAKLKLLLALPLVCALVLVFAEPRTTAVAAPAGLQDQQVKKISVDDPAAQKLLKAQEEAKKLAVLEKDLKAKLEETKDASLRSELKKKLETVLHKRQEVETFIGENGGPIPPPPPPPNLEELKAQYKMLVEKEADVKAQLEKSTNETEKTKLAETLEKIHQKQAQVKEMAMAATGSTKSGPNVGVKIPETAEELEQGLTKLQAKQADIQEKLKNTTEPRQIEELKAMLEKTLQIQAVYKVQLEKVKSGKIVKGEKVEKIVK